MKQIRRWVTGLALVLATVAVLVAAAAVPAAHAIGIGCSNKCLETLTSLDTFFAVYE